MSDMRGSRPHGINPDIDTRIDIIIRVLFLALLIAGATAVLYALVRVFTW